MSIPNDLELELIKYRSIISLQKNRLLHIKGGKLNIATLFITLSKMSKNKFLTKLNEFYFKINSKEKIFSTFRLIEVINSIDKKS